MTPIILILAVMCSLAIALATSALVLGRPDRQARSDMAILSEEVSKLWEALQGEVRRQAVRASRANSARSVSPLVGHSLPSGDGTLLSDRSALLAEFERRKVVH